VIRFSADGQFIAQGYYDGSVELWSVKNTRRLSLWKPHFDMITAVAFSRDGRFIATAGRTGVVRLWKFPELTFRDSIAVTVADIPYLEFSDDGRRLFAATNEGCVRVLDLTTGREVLTLKGHVHPYVASLGFAPDRRTLISMSLKDVMFWRAETWK
jgi:WD40 repeat protein